MDSWVTQLLQPVEGDPCPSSAVSVCVRVLFVCTCWWLTEPGRVCRGDSMEYFSKYHRKKLLILCTASVLYYLTCIHYIQCTTVTKYFLLILKLEFLCALLDNNLCFLWLLWFLLPLIYHTTDQTGNSKHYTGLHIKSRTVLVQSAIKSVKEKHRWWYIISTEDIQFFRTEKRNPQTSLCQHITKCIQLISAPQR